MEKVKWLRYNCIKPSRRFYGRTLAESQGGWAHGHLGMVRRILGLRRRYCQLVVVSGWERLEEVLN